MLTCSPASGTLCPSAEAAIYLANAPITATLAAKAIRAHWRVEITSHYSRDETLGEDRSLVRQILQLQAPPPVVPPEDLALPPSDTTQAATAPPVEPRICPHCHQGRPLFIRRLERGHAMGP